MSRELLKAFRVTHLYVGVFIAPAVLFFALTGALQTFGLHETNRDHPNYVPARWIVVLGQIHKKQTAVVPERKRPAVAQPATGPAAGPGAEAAEPPRRAKGEVSGQSAAAPDRPASPPAAEAKAPAQARVVSPLPLRIFFLIVSVGLFWSTLTGVYMAYTYHRNKTLVTLSLVAGAVLPILLLLV